MTTPPIICITGACNGSGKTTLAVSILRAFPGRFDALKVSTIYPDGPCPRSAVNDCACRSLEGAFTRVTDEERLRDADTDTGRMAAALEGNQIGWTVARPGAHAVAWQATRPEFSRRPLLVEGNSIALTVPADLRIFVYDPTLSPRKWKGNAASILERGPLIVENGHRDAERRIELPLEGALVGQPVREPVDTWAEPTVFDAIRGVLAHASTPTREKEVLR